MAIYTIGSAKGKQIASSMKAGDTYKASDGSTWKKNANGAVSVTTASGDYTANAYTGSSGGKKSSSSPVSYGSGVTPTNTYYDPDSGNVKHISEAPDWLSGEQAAPSWIPKGNSGTAGYGDSGSSRNLATSAYDEALAALEEKKRQEKEAARKRTQATIDSINSNVPTINQDYENQQAQNYITHTKNMFGLGDFLRAQGLSGGMTESKAGELTANYETSRNTADQAKNNALQNIQNLIAQAQATGDQELATIASSATKAYQELLAQQAAAELQAEQTATAQAIDESRYQDSLTQRQFENDLATKEYNLALQKAKSSGTSGGGSGSSGSKLTASTINNMLSSGLIDENQAAEMYNSIGIVIPGSQNDNAVDYTKVTKIINGLGNYMNGQGTNQAAVTYVQGLLDKGSISQAEYNYILKQFGYNM